RGHSNVQGDRTMGIWEKPKEAFLDRLAERFAFEPPREHGYDTVHAIEAMHTDKVKVFVAMGGNFLSASPDTDFTAEALGKVSLNVQISTKLNRSHLVHGETALILPCLARSERDMQASGQQRVSVENSMGKVHASCGDRLPASTHLRSEPWIVASMAAASLNARPEGPWLDWIKDYDQIRDLIQDCIPGFEQYNERLDQAGGFYLPNGARERKFNTPDGKAHFSLNALPTQALTEGRYLMMTIRSHDQYNTTIYGLHDRYRGIYEDRRVILMNAADIQAAGLEAKQLVNLTSHFQAETRTARAFRVVPYDIPRGCTATYFPEANVLVPIASRAKGSNTPASKRVVISIEAL
ncbi:MAG: molybdopterin dinucleotide binding domain-containing protein, partial [Bacteroidota bacterium]